MFIQKTLHVQKTLEETKSRVLALPFHRRNWDGLQHVEFRNGAAEVEFEAALGVGIFALIQELPSDNPDEILFHTCDGNISVVGMIGFALVKEGLTEITLTLDYTVQDPLAAFINRITGALDRFLNAQLAIIEPILRGEVKAETPVYSEPAPALSIWVR